MRSACVSFGFLLLSVAAAAQQYVISTVAGGGAPTPPLSPDADIGWELSVATDGTGNAYFASASLHAVFKLDRDRRLTRVAGNSRPGYAGDGGPATSARLYVPSGVAVDADGNLFIADTGNHRIRKVFPNGLIVTVAGDSASGFSGDGGPAVSARLSGPKGLALDAGGNLFFVDSWTFRIRRVSAAGIITTVAGNGTQGLSGDGGPATSAQLMIGTGGPGGLAVDRAGNLFVPEDGGNRVRKVSPSGIITTLAGNGAFGSAGDDGPATSAQLRAPTGVAVDSSGNLFIVQRFAVRKVSTNGIITTVAGNGACCGSQGVDGPATSVQLNVSGVAVDSVDNLLIAEWGRIRKVSGGIITEVSGNGSYNTISGDGGPAINARLLHPNGVAVDSAGNLFITELSNHRVRRVTPSGTITTVAGGGAGSVVDGAAATSVRLSLPGGIAVDSEDNLFIANSGQNNVLKVSPAGILTVVAGRINFCSNDDSPGTEERFGYPAGVAVDGGGNLFIAISDFETFACIRRVAPNGVVTTVAGSGALVPNPRGIAVDGVGNLFIASWDRLRKLAPDGTMTTVAGGDGALGVAMDATGNLFVADYFNGRVRKISPSGIVTTVAGDGPNLTDGGAARSAALAGPAAVAVDSAGNIFVAELVYNAVRVLRPTNETLLIGAVLDAASQRADPVSPGKIVVIHGAGLGPSGLIQNQPADRLGGGLFGTELGETQVSFNGIAAPILYTSDTGVAAVVPYALTGTTARVRVTYRGEVSAAFAVPVTPSAPSLFTLNQTGTGQAAAINAVDGTANTAANPVKIGGFISLYATGEGQTAPAGVDGRLGGSALTRPVLPVSVTVGGVPAIIQYAGSASGQVAGVMRVNVQIPSGVQPGGYVPVVLQVGDAPTMLGAVWIAVAGN